MDDQRCAPASSSTPWPPIRTLKVELLSHNSTKYVPCIPNAREATPFETEFFKGVAMIVIRTKPIDEHFHDFFHGRKRLFEVQVQGKFKREPIGEIFVGAEGSNKLDLGILTRSISRVVLQFISTMVGDLHYSFGDTQEGMNYELPHVVSPIFPTFDKIVVTPPGETPPPLGVPFPEDPEYRKVRLKFRFIKDAQVDLNSTYSFSVNTSNLDLLTWTIVGIPMVKPMDMRTYSGSGSVQLIGYEIPRTVQAKFPNTHPHKQLNYVFSMKLTPINPDEQPIIDLPLMSSEDELGPPDEATGNEEIPETPVDEDREEDGERAVDDSDEDENKSGDEAKVEKSSSQTTPFSQRRNLMPSGGVSGWLRKKFTSKNKSPLDRPNAVETTGEQALEISEYTMTDFEFEAIGDLSFCPACIELNEYKRDGRRRIYYVLPLPAWMQQKLEGHPDAELLKYRVRTYSEITKRLALLQLVKSYKNGRISTNEKRRCQIVETMANLHAESHSRLEKLLYAQTEADHHFLGGNVEVEVEMGKDSSKTWCGAVAVALSRRHWSEQYLILTKERMVLQRSRDSKKAAFSLPLSEIRSVRAVPHNYCPVPWLGFFEVETYSRVFTFMVRSDMQINGWLEAFMTAGSASSVPSRLSGGKDSYIREEVFIAKPPCWKIDKKRVYNFRRIAISGQILLNDDKSAATISPNNLSENILRAAFLLTQSDSETNWLRFWDLISQLQCVCLVGLTDTQRLCFFLNIYHVMVIHGCLMFGAPPGWNHWNAFYHQISYIIGFELVSIAEVEHCILRASMTKSSMFTAVALAAPPQTVLPALALNRRDFRLHFAINCGSLSLMPCVPIYDPENCDLQLDEVTKRTLELCLEVDASKKLVTLPRLPLQDYSSWRSDVATNVKQQPVVGVVDCLRALTPYMSRAQKLSMISLLADPQHIGVKYRNLNFRCRLLHRLDIPTPTTSSNVDT